MKKIFVMILMLCIYQSTWATEIKLSCRYTDPSGDVETVIFSFDDETRMVDGESINRHCSENNSDLCYEGSITDTRIRWDYLYQGGIARRTEIDRGTGEYTKISYNPRSDLEVAKGRGGRELITRGSCSPFKKAF